MAKVRTSIHNLNVCRQKLSTNDSTIPMLRIRYDSDLTTAQFLSVAKLVKYCYNYNCDGRFLKEELSELGLGLPVGFPDYDSLCAACSERIDELWLSSRNHGSIFSDGGLSGFQAMDYLVIQYIRQIANDNCMLDGFECEDFCGEGVEMCQRYSAAIISIVNYLQSFFMNVVWDSGDEVTMELLSQFSPSHTFLGECTHYCDSIRFLAGSDCRSHSDAIEAMLYELSGIANHVSFCALITDFMANGFHTDERSKGYDRGPEYEVFRNLWIMIQGHFKGCRIYRIEFPCSPVCERKPVYERGQGDYTTRMKVFFQFSGDFYVMRFDCSHKGEEFYHLNIMDEKGAPFKGLDHMEILPGDAGVQAAFTRLCDYVSELMFKTSSIVNSSRDDDLRYLQILKTWHERSVMTE